MANVFSRRKRSGEKKSDAQRRLREILAELDRGIAPTKVQYKVGEWLDKWLQEKIIPNRRQKTIDRYEGIIRLHIKPSLEARGAGATLHNAYTGSGSKLLDEGMGPKGVQAVHHVLSGAVKHALRMEMIFRGSPWRWCCHLPSPRRKRTVPKWTMCWRYCRWRKRRRTLFGRSSTSSLSLGCAEVKPWL